MALQDDLALSPIKEWSLALVCPLGIILQKKRQNIEYSHEYSVDSKDQAYIYIYIYIRTNTVGK